MPCQLLAVAAMAEEVHQLWTEAAPGDSASAPIPTPTAASGIGPRTPALGGEGHNPLLILQHLVSSFISQICQYLCNQLSRINLFC